MLPIRDIAADWIFNFPELYYDTPVLEKLELPEWDNNIAPPPVLNIYLDGKYFTMPDIVLPDAQDAPPIFEGLLQPEIVDNPPELNTTQPDEPPTLETEQPDNPPQITETPPFSTIQPIIQQPGELVTLEASRPEIQQIAEQSTSSTTYQSESSVAGQQRNLTTGNTLTGTATQGSAVPGSAATRNQLGSSTTGNQFTIQPPRPDNFWDSLNDMHGQLMRFDVDNYLTSTYRWEIQRMLWNYERYMDEVRFDLASQFNENVNMLQDIRFGYTNFLWNLRSDALQAERDTVNQLHNTLNVFSQRVEETSEDTRDRLEGFANMMPESRTPIGPNRNLTRFAVAPFDVVTPQLREAAATIAPVEMQAESVVPMLENHLWIALGVLGGVFVVTLGSYGVTYFRKKEVE